MILSESSIQQIERALRKASSKFPANAECLPLTDLHLQVKQESGELRIFDDDDHEITRCVVEDWIDNKCETFYEELQPALTELIGKLSSLTEHFALLRPYSFVLIGEDKETIADLYLVDDDTIVISGEFMKGLSDDLEQFWERLEKQTE